MLLFPFLFLDIYISLFVQQHCNGEFAGMPEFPSSAGLKRVVLTFMVLEAKEVKEAVEEQLEVLRRRMKVE